MNVCIFGLGRIGLPISLVCADSGMRVIGIDINKTLISELKDGKTSFDEPGMQRLLDDTLGSTFFPKDQNDYITDDLKRAEYIMLAVGTGFAKYPQVPDLSILYSIIDQLVETGIRGKTLILRVTLPIGTSERVISRIEAKTGFLEGKDFWFAFVPERIMEGIAVKEESSLPKIIGACSDQGFEKVKRFFEKVGGDIVRVKDPRTAEFIKLIDNSWRNTRFAYANELAYLAEDIGVDVTEAIRCANRGYERNEIPQPGPVSGYCLGKDPYLLEIAFENIAEKRGFNSMWYYGRLANDWLIEKVVEEVKGERILVVGLSFKANIDDYRYSHSIELVRSLLSRGYDVGVCDPYLGQNTYTSLPDDISGRVKIYHSLATAGFDTVIFSTNHNEYVEMMPGDMLKGVKVIDLWNLYPDLKDSPEFEYAGLGNLQTDG